MIFFIVNKNTLEEQRRLKIQHASKEQSKVVEEKSDTAPFLTVTDYPFRKPEGVFPRSLVAWNEVFDSPGALYQAVVVVSQQDPLCQRMLLDARALYGITLPVGLSHTIAETSFPGMEGGSGSMSISSSDSTEDLIDSATMQEIVDDIFICPKNDRYFINPASL